jgi:hypothetical protein
VLAAVVVDRVVAGVAHHLHKNMEWVFKNSDTPNSEKFPENSRILGL